MAAVVFYLLAYAVMNLGAFAVVTLIARSGDRRTDVEDYRGIGFQSPALSLTLSLFLLSLLGVPLTAGFMGKVVVFSEALGAGVPLAGRHRRAKHGDFCILLPAPHRRDVLPRAHD